MPGSTLGEWGPAGWNTLHAIAHTLPETLDSSESAQLRLFLDLFARYLPCKRCSVHFAKILERRATPDALSGRAAVVKLLHDAHNDVNARLGKRIWTLEEHYDVYSLRRAAARRVARAQMRQRAAIVLVVICLAWQLNCRCKNKMARP